MLTYKEAVSALSGEVKSIDELFSLVSNVSGEVVGAEAGSTYLLYSGNMPDGSYSSDAALKLIQSDPSVFNVTQSEVGKLLRSDEFVVALGRSICLEIFGPPLRFPSNPVRRGWGSQ